MATCTFFGHRQISENIEPSLRAALTELIENENVCEFYVGCEGQFDRTAKSVLSELKKEYPHIKITVVLAYLNKQYENIPDSLFPEGLERVPLRFAIPKRNEWMIKQSVRIRTRPKRQYFGPFGIVVFARQSLTASSAPKIPQNTARFGSKNFEESGVMAMLGKNTANPLWICEYFNEAEPRSAPSKSGSDTHALLNTRILS